MLTHVLNPDGRSRIVKIREVLRYLGVDITRPNHAPERTPDERRRRNAELHRKYRRQKREQEWEMKR